MDEAVEGIDRRSRLLRAGTAVGVGVLLVVIALGFAANARPAGLGVAPALASDPLHFRAAIALFYGCVALLVSVLWPRLSRDTRGFRSLRRYVTVVVALCGAGPLFLLAVNYSIVTGLTPHHLAALPAAVPLVIAALYAVVVHQLSGTVGVGLGARLMLRSSYVWLLTAAVLHLGWTLTRILAGTPGLLWFIERPALEVAMIGFALTGSLCVLLTNLNSIYHSRDMAQTLIRSHMFLNGLVALWGLSLMWALRFPGGYQGLASAVIGLGLMIVLAIVAASSGLLQRRNLAWLGGNSGDGMWAGLLASMAMLLVIITGVIIGFSGVLLAGLGQRPPEGLLAAQIMTVLFGIVPLCTAAAVAPSIQRREIPLITGGFMVMIGVLLAAALVSVDGLVARSLAVPAVGAEMVIGAGLLLVVLATRCYVACR